VHRVTVRVSPEDASVEVDGAPADVRGGAFDLSGALGSGHRVRVARGSRELWTDVFVTEKGAVPPRVELPPPSPSPQVGGAPRPATSRPPPSHAGDPMRKPE
jgi:serine/threonine-protein kinase